MKKKKGVVAKAKKRRRRRREEFARTHDKNRIVTPPAQIMPPYQGPELSAEELRLRAIKRAEKARKDEKS